MKQKRIHLNDVIYNAGTQSFEALVTIEGNGKARRYACAIEAPISTSFEDAAKGLKTQAMRQDRKGTGFYSQMRRHAPTLRAGRARFDPRTWLAQLGLMPNSDAA
ncbi:orotidine 5-phosphate decarboxylase [uncultured Sulfitobacter sp.]|uniref:orotidine 5-phosphate decarboxylase n=1 Tax=uncultured Sulfitobacter sp. TaxID=191468 RepID=UPI00262A4C2F|nr:orotidine 5-phosphate decarboxylase [uncultured Sulfitobacter sp.]